MQRVVASLVAVAVAASLVTAAEAGAADRSTRAQRDRVRRQRAAAAASIDALRAEDAEVTAALQDMNAAVASQEQALAAAEDALTSARAEEAAVTARITSLRESLRTMAVQHYMSGGRTADSIIRFGGSDLSEQARRTVLAELALGSATETADELRAAQEDLQLARQRAEVERAQVEQRLGAITEIRNKQAALAVRVDERIEARLAEAASLERLDAGLSAQLAREQAALAARNRGSRGAPARVVRGNVPLRTVRGITVHADIADELEAMLAAAESSGLVFGGGGYRDPEDQRAVRRRNCPNPESSPPSACRPPTARPGYSMHEQGRAIDFTHDGSTVRSGSPGYRWLSANAGRYGFRNLPGEPWHWSTNGN